jgi:hypothetical protein
VNFGKDYVYFGQKLVAEPTSHEPHEPHFLLFNIVSIILFFTREYTKCTAGSTFCFVVLGKPLIKLASISADS